MYYEINVSLHGQHLFATAERSIRSKWELRRLYDILKMKFHESEGYEITVTYWSKTGKEITEEEILGND